MMMGSGQIKAYDETQGDLSVYRNAYDGVLSFWDRPRI